MDPFVSLVSDGNGGTYVFFEVDAADAGGVTELKLDLDGEVHVPDAFYSVTRLGVEQSGNARVFGIPIPLPDDSNQAPDSNQTDCELPGLILAESDVRDWAEAGLVRLPDPCTAPG